jgi:hypothetical protein
MRRIAIAVGTLCLTLSAACVRAQDPARTPPPELKKLGIWIGDWTLSGTAQDRPDGPRYNLLWQLHEHWVLNGFFLQVEQIWRGGGQVMRSLEMLSYDPGKMIYTDSGFGSDGSTWSLTATFHGETMLETGSTLGADGMMTRCRMTWVFGNHGRTLTGTEECHKGGARWKAVAVRGQKSRSTQ